MGPFLIVLIVVVCVLLALVILVQNPKGGGLAAGFQSAGAGSGVKRTTDFLEKATWYLGIALFVLCVVSARFYDTGNANIDRVDDDIELPGGDDLNLDGGDDE